jgi:hypothetical protein
VSHTAALRALIATASVARAKQNSQSANKYAVCAAANAVIITPFVANAAPGTIEPRIGAGSTQKINDLHFLRYDSVLLVTCSDVDFHVLPTKPLLANRRLPTDVALSQNTFVSWSANEQTAALNTLINGHAKYNSLYSIDVGDDDDICSNTNGTNNENVVAVADTPTHNGVIAFARSALAKNPSASLAQHIVAAATSLPSATATRPTYSAPIPIAAETFGSIILKKK